MATVYYVIPCYNEQEVLPSSARKLLDKLREQITAGLAGPQSRLLFVDDGSRDETWSLIRGLCEQEPLCSGLKLAHNRGHQNALLAGLMTARERADCTISIDADLQDDLAATDEFLKKFAEGYEIVYGVRNSRQTDSSFKRTTARGFYTVMRLLGTEVVYDHADFRLMSRRALDALSEYRETNLFLRGIVPTIGLRSTSVLYDRLPRTAGESKYPLRKMLSFAADGITSFSVKPLKLISGLGLLVFFGSLIALLCALIACWAGSDVSGWTFACCSLWLLGGIQLLCLGIIGQYLGKVFGEVKDRPRYFVEEFLE